MRALLCLLLCFPASLLSDEILWLRPDFPPATFVRGPLQDKGYNDLTRLFLARHLPEYNHSVEQAGYERIVLIMKERNACIVGFYKSPEREQWIVYSQPRLIILANGLVFRARDKDKFLPYMQPDGIDLPSLAANQALIAGAADGRLYKGSIDDVIERQRHSEHFLLRSGQDVFLGLLNMLDLGRIDYTFGFPVELTYQQQVHALSQPMAFLPISGTPQMTESFIACRRNPWGEQVIARIDQILSQHRMDPEYLSYYQSWLDAETRIMHQQLSESRFVSTNGED